MRLESHNDAVVEVTPLRYQFGASPEPRDWDANWLSIATRVELPDGLSWSSIDPCLTTWEARELGAWLEGVHAGDLQPAEFGGAEDERLLVFTEPNLGFSLARRDDETATIRVHFSLESRPPWLRDDDEADLFGYFVEVDLAIEAVAAAATTWSEELAAFPVR